MKILLVDDSTTMRRIEKNVLVSIGYDDIEEAGDGVEAVKKLKELEFKCDLILLDWNMPNMDGITLLKKLQSVPQLASIPVIMVTTEAEKERVVEAMQAGAKSYVVKPFDAETLTGKIQSVVS